MTKRDSKRPGRPETPVLQIDVVGREAIRQVFDYGLPRKKRMGLVLKSGEDVQGGHRD